MAVNTQLDSAAVPVSESTWIRTWQLFAVLVFIQVALAIVMNKGIMTPDVYHELLGSRLSAEQIDEHMAMTQRWQVWGYVATPLVLLVRIGFTALLIQLVLLLLVTEVPFRTIFRAALWAYSMVLAGSAFQLIWLYRLPPHQLTEQALAAVPGSFAAYFPQLAAAGGPLSHLLNVITLFGLGWWLFFALALENARRVRFLPALIAVGVVWVMITVTKWAMAAYMANVAG